MKLGFGAVVLFGAMQAGCASDFATAEVILTTAQPQALNVVIDTALDGQLDPLSVSTGSVRVTRRDGSAVPAEISAAGAHVLVQLVVTDALLVEVLSEVWVELVGLPSTSALMTLDGRPLRATVRRRVKLLPVLRAASSDPPRLIAINGVALSGDPVRLDGDVVLSFSDVLDPATVSPSACPVYPIAGDITLLTPLQPRVRWQCVGDRFDVVLAVPAEFGRIQFILRKSGIRDMVGRPAEPAGATVELISP